MGEKTAHWILTKHGEDVLNEVRTLDEFDQLNKRIPLRYNWFQLNKHLDGRSDMQILKDLIKISLLESGPLTTSHVTNFIESNIMFGHKMDKQGVEQLGRNLIELKNSHFHLQVKNNLHHLTIAGLESIDDLPKPFQCLDFKMSNQFDPVVEFLSILSKCKYLILEGVPGTGKTYLYHQIKERKIHLHYTRFVTFHPSSDYTDFIGGIRPYTKDNKLSFQPTKGHLLKVLDQAQHGPVLLWIDEINRANVPRVFGDLISILGSKSPPETPFRIPNVGLPNDELQLTNEQHKNLYIVATQNTSDRSITPLDSAIRRRFWFYRLSPLEDPALLRQQFPGIQEHVDLYSAINKLLKEKIGADAQFGHSYLYEMGEDPTNVWRYSILPNIIDTMVSTQIDITEELNGLVKEEPLRLKIKKSGTGYGQTYTIASLDEEQQIVHDEEVIVNLLLQKQNVILEGVPGTGKSFIRTKLQKIWPQKHNDRALELETITFHPATTYEEFVGGIFPTSNNDQFNDQLRFDYKEGSLQKLANTARRDPDTDYLFFIDELNRANIPRVMGEMLTLIENSKRVQAEDQKATQNSRSASSTWQVAIHSKPDEDVYLELPDNLYILATMNTSDRSVVSIDGALRRRFGYYRMESKLHKDAKNYIKTELGARWNENLENLFDVLVGINDILRKLGPDSVLGHSYLFEIRPKNEVRHLMKYSILPQIVDILNNMDGAEHVGAINQQLENIPNLNLALQPTKTDDPISSSILIQEI